MHTIRHLLRLLAVRLGRNVRRHSRLPYLGESMAWFNAPTRR